MEIQLVLVSCRVVIVYGCPPLPVQLRAVVSTASRACGKMAGGGGRRGLRVPLLDGLLQVHLELEGWLGYGVGQVVRHINLQTHREQK